VGNLDFATEEDDLISFFEDEKINPVKVKIIRGLEFIFELFE
jgi:hypothetical protein